MDADDVLDRARGILANGWVRGSFATHDDDGRWGHCVAGALFTAATPDTRLPSDAHHDAYHEAWDRVETTIREQYPNIDIPPWANLIPYWNDHHAEDADAVLAIIDKTRSNP